MLQLMADLESQKLQADKKKILHKNTVEKLQKKLGFLEQKQSNQQNNDAQMQEMLRMLEANQRELQLRNSEMLKEVQLQE